MGTEHKRKLVHISMVCFAFTIGWVQPALITLATVIAFCFNLFLLPRITGRGLERTEDLARGYSLGMLAYPGILFVISLIFFKQQVFMAVAWGAMAFGDGFAGLIGSSVRGPKISWNSDKSVIGTLAFVALGTPLTLGLLMTLPETSRLGIVTSTWAIAVFMGILAAALIETVPGMIDDNLVVPLTAAAVAFVVTQVNHFPPLPLNWVVGLALVLTLVILSIGSKKIDLPGGLCGGLIAWLIFLGGGLTGLLALFLFFVLGSFASRFKWREKQKMGAAQENHGKRSVRHALANGGVAGICGLLGWLFPSQSELWSIALVASLASATADTLASELGTVYGKSFVNILTFKPEQPGIDGVVSIQGTLFGCLGSAVIALTYGLMAGWDRAVVVIFLAGFWGNYVDSVLGATLQRSEYMTNDTVNFANTAAAALLALLALGWLPYA